MLKPELIEKVAVQSGQTREKVRQVVDTIYDVTKEALASGESVMVCGLGKLEVIKRGKKMARNLHTGERVVVPPRKVVILKVSTGLTEAVNA